MQHAGLLAPLCQNIQVSSLARALEHSEGDHLVYGLIGSQKAYFLAALASLTSRPFLVLSHDAEEGRRLAADLNAFFNSASVPGSFPQAAFLPPREVMPFEVFARTNEVSAQRIPVLAQMLRGLARVVVTTVGAATTYLVPPEIFRASIREYATGTEVRWEELLKDLVSLGYERAEVVEVPGQFSARGGILDLFPLTSEQPVRMEFFGDTIDSMRYFDPASQRSTETVERIRITAARELILPPEVLQRGLAALRRELGHTLKRLEEKQPLGQEVKPAAGSRSRSGRLPESSDRENMAKNLEQRVGTVLERLEAYRDTRDLEAYQPYFYPQGAWVGDYFPRSPILVWDEPLSIQETMERENLLRSNTYADLAAQGAVLPAQARIYLSPGELEKRHKGYARLSLTMLPQRVPGISPRSTLGFTAKRVAPFLGKPDLLVEEVRSWRYSGQAVVLVTQVENRVQRLKETLADHGIEAVVLNDVQEPPVPGQVVITRGQLNHGFEFPSLRLVVVTDWEIYGQKRKAQPRRYAKGGLTAETLPDLRVGDYVVHIHHGIGRYLGIENMEVAGIRRDYLAIQYAGEDRLYVPTDQAGLVQKYVGAEGHVPRLNRLGSNEWSRAKRKVKESVRDMAKELLNLYAARKAVPGHAFGKDTVWQREFEDNFPYVETPDQLRAIQEVKADMEKPEPMDRLLCGDVGYGKTEVAMRAAFKVIMDGRQVAVLVPTTVLAQQHFHTFRERFAPFPARIEVLSRFRSTKEQRDVIRAIREGQVDVVIGTHRLLSKDVRFKDLGLLIIDEEQRFGVVHKERLKTLKQTVDVLTLTATPIPRTLYMSLAGARDMSVIETPPEDRYPVETYVVEYSPELVRDAIRRELARGGQVYYVHNRIPTIEQVAAYLQQLVPEARLAIAHGQMHESQLEQVMLDFVEGKSDVLVCTTIIENGLDIANVNTLIVEEADSLGLAQLYQLRGRVGRSNRLAYAYFTYRRDKILHEVAQKRLAAIREFTEFGAGFKIALRDLEIRGAGNLLGPEQHGHMLAVGFDLYCRLLQEAVDELKGKPPEEPVQPAVELKVDAFINDEYVRTSGLKMELYQRLTKADTMAEIQDIEAQMIDRYGKMPPAVRHLVSLSRIRVLAKEVGVTTVQHQATEVRISFGEFGEFKGEKLLRLAQSFPRRLSFSALGGLHIRVNVTGLKQGEVLELLESLFWKIKSLSQPQEALL